MIVHRLFEPVGLGLLGLVLLGFGVYLLFTGGDGRDVLCLVIAASVLFVRVGLVTREFVQLKRDAEMDTRQAEREAKLRR